MRPTRRRCDASWDRRRGHLRRSQFQVEPQLSPVTGEPSTPSTPSTPSFHRSSDSIYIFSEEEELDRSFSPLPPLNIEVEPKSNKHDESHRSSDSIDTFPEEEELDRSFSPLPPLNIEVEPKTNKHDESDEFYKQLEIKIMKIYKDLFMKDKSDVSEKSGSSKPDISINRPKHLKKRTDAAGPSYFTDVDENVMTETNHTDAEKQKIDSQKDDSKSDEVESFEESAEVESAEEESAVVEPAEVESAEVESAEVEPAEAESAEEESAEVEYSDEESAQESHIATEDQDEELIENDVSDNDNAQELIAELKSRQTVTRYPMSAGRALVAERKLSVIPESIEEDESRNAQGVRSSRVFLTARRSLDTSASASDNRNPNETPEEINLHASDVDCDESIDTNWRSPILGKKKTNKNVARESLRKRRRSSSSSQNKRRRVTGVYIDVAERASNKSMTTTDNRNPNETPEEINHASDVDCDESIDTNWRSPILGKKKTNKNVARESLRKRRRSSSSSQNKRRRVTGLYIDVAERASNKSMTTTDIDNSNESAEEIELRRSGVKRFPIICVPTERASGESATATVPGIENLIEFAEGVESRNIEVMRSPRVNVSAGSMQNEPDEDSHHNVTEVREREKAYIEPESTQESFQNIIDCDETRDFDTSWRSPVLGSKCKKKKNDRVRVGKRCRSSFTSQSKRRRVTEFSTDVGVQTDSESRRSSSSQNNRSRDSDVHIDVGVPTDSESRRSSSSQNNRSRDSDVHIDVGVPTDSERRRSSSSQNNRSRDSDVHIDVGVQTDSERRRSSSSQNNRSRDSDVHIDVGVQTDSERRRSSSSQNNRSRDSDVHIDVGVQTDRERRRSSSSQNKRSRDSDVLIDVGVQTDFESLRSSSPQSNRGRVAAVYIDGGVQTDFESLRSSSPQSNRGRVAAVYIDGGVQTDFESLRSSSQNNRGRVAAVYIDGAVQTDFESVNQRIMSEKIFVGTPRFFKLCSCHANELIE